ncbi:MAG: glycosyltransferase family 4 protein, partial [Elusimicrobia bacterium]|nr:glycosyltransferase family 4 protein [Elusimicrobiota bacterium]
HPYLGGAEKQALELAAALRRRGAQVSVATRRVGGLPRCEEIRGVPVTRLWRAGSGLLDSVSFAACLAAFLWRQRSRYDAIHVHLAGSPAVAAALLGRLLGKRVVVKLGGGAGIGELAASSRTRAGRLKLRALARWSPLFVAVTRELVGEARLYLGPVAVFRVPNGVDVERYKPVPPARKAALRRRLGWPADATIFLYVGRLSAEKRLPRFAELWAEEARKAPASSFFAAVGAGPEREALSGALKRAGALERSSVPGPMADVEAAYAAADVFVLPSISEGLSNALLEAMASGCAALASRVGGALEAVEEGRSGLLFAPRDEGELRRCLRRFLDDPALAAQLGRRGRELAAARYSLETVAQAYEALYRCGGRRSAAISGSIKR